MCERKKGRSDGDSAPNASKEVRMSLRCGSPRGVDLIGGRDVELALLGTADKTSLQKLAPSNLMTYGVAEDW